MRLILNVNLFSLPRGERLKVFGLHFSLKPNTTAAHVYSLSSGSGPYTGYRVFASGHFLPARVG